MARLGLPDRAFLFRRDTKSRSLSYLSRLDVGNFHIEVESLSRQGMIEIDDDGFVLTSWTRMAIVSH